MALDMPHSQKPPPAERPQHERAERAEWTTPDSTAAPGDRASLSVAAAWRALQCGHDPSARDLAQALLADAEARRDQHSQAHALSILAHCDRMNSRLRQAHASSQLAIRHFRRLGDAAGEAVALSTLAHVASSLGRTEEAVEAALLSVSLQGQLPHGPQRALSLNYLGAAYFWSRSFDRATAAFEAAAQACADNAPPLSPYQPRLNLLFAEAFRLATERFYAGSLPSVARMGLLLDQCEATRLAWGDECLLPGLARLAQAFQCVLSGLYFCWTGSFDEARLALADGQARSDAPGPPHWIKAACAWLHAELAWSAGDWSRADPAVDAMIAAAELAEHEQFACLAHTIASGLLAQRGDTGRAMAHLRALRLREERIRAESLESRARIVQWQLDARRSAAAQDLPPD